MGAKDETLDVEEFNDWDFPTEPIGGGNPYYRCVYCKKSVPEINYREKGHGADCEWLKIKKRKNLIERMEKRLAKIIEEEGNQEMADGFSQALEMVKECLD